MLRRLGLCLCLLKRGKNRPLSLISAAFIRFIQGIPAVVILMVLFYVVVIAGAGWLVQTLPGMVAKPR